MIRAIGVTLLLVAGCLMVSLPAVTPAERYLELIHAEDTATRQRRGDEAADRVLARMLALQGARTPVSEPPPSLPRPGIDAAVAASVAQMSERLFGNAYFRAIDAQMALAAYRSSALWELWRLGAVLLVVAAIDGLALRAVRAHELVPHWAELFTLSLALAIALGGALVIWCFVPRLIDPAWVQALLLSIPLMLGRAVANYHSIR